MFTEDLTFFFNDFGVTCTAGAVTAKGILDMPSQIVANGMVLTTDYRLAVRTSDFGSLRFGDFITVNGTMYSVRETMMIDDGAISEIFLQLVDTVASAVFDVGVFVDGVFA